MRNTLFGLSLLIAASAAQAADFKLALSNKVIAADFTSPQIGQGLEFTLGGLHHTDNGNVFTSGIQVSQQVNSGLSAGLGGKMFFVQNDVKNASALALGGQFDWALPGLPQVHVGAHGWFAPQVTSFNDSKNLQDIGAFVSYRVLSNAEVFASYRRVRIDFENRDGVTVQSGALFGMKLFF
ncbi:MAG: hypothetical protein H7Z15_05700 [Rhizobacter sp.]|nr:hypothetical protein [Rhizobacter sp.]